MTATAHALVAGAIATKVNNPGLIIILNLTAHFVMDSIPHWDIGTNWRERRKYITGIISISETLFAIGLTYFIFRDRVPLFLLLISVLTSILPDWLETPWYIFFAHSSKFAPVKNAGFFEKLFYGIYKFENFFHKKTTPVFGILTQIITVTFFLLLLR